MLQAASALWSLATENHEAQQAIAAAGGIAALVHVLGLGTATGFVSDRTYEQAAGALAALALDNPSNEQSIAQQLVALLGSTDLQAAARAARRQVH